MYHSRVHFENDLLSLALDTRTGELMELIRKETGDNYIKSNLVACPPPFCLETESGARITAPPSSEAANDPQLAAKITHQIAGNKQIIRVSYEKLMDQNRVIYHCPLTYTLTLTDHSSLIQTEIEFVPDNMAVNSCLFPYLSGIWLGEDYADDILLYPFNGGIRMENPITSLSAPKKQIHWRWQDYHYIYNYKGMGLSPDSLGYYTLDHAYSGPLSMAYLDLFDGKNGLYLGADPQKISGIISLVARTKGESDLGMNFAIRHRLPVAKEVHRLSGEILLHRGDWHEAADYYRTLTSRNTRSCPEWFDQSSGLAAHYDFKYQNSGVVHHFADIPRLAEEAKEIGLDHLLFSGWHKDGFDNGFPQYYADDQLGNLEELKSGIRFAHNLGIKVSFYLNSRLANIKYQANSELIESGCIRQKDGSLYIEQYGSKNLKFATMCAASDAWQQHMKQSFAYVKEAGADGIYFDQIGMAPPLLCYAKDHHHPVDDWVTGCRQLISLAKELDLNIIIEGCSDLYGPMVGGQLISTFSYIDVAYPRLFRYTFPHQGLVDMVYPKKNLAMRPVFVANRAKQMIDTAIITGMTPWVYDLEEDNTFFRDPEMLDYLKKALIIRKAFLSVPGKKTFRDVCGLFGNPNAALFETKDGVILLAAEEESLLLKGKHTCASALWISQNGNLETDKPTVTFDGTHTKIQTENALLGLWVLKRA